MSGNKRPQLATRKSRQLFEPELLYQFWSAAGGIVLHAMKLAEEAGEKRVPKKHHIWANYAKEYKFSERMAQEQKQKWDQYHADREAKQQKVMDGLAETFEVFASKFQTSMMLDFMAMESDDKNVQLAAMRKLSKLFGNMKAVNQFFRMYLRARGQPETITHNIQEITDLVVGYRELESGQPKAKAPEEARKMAEG